MGKYPPAHIFYINYHLGSFEFYADSTLHHLSKHNLILRTDQFTDVRCKKQEALTIFSKSEVIFIIISACSQSSWIFQCNGFWKRLNTTTWLGDRNQFFKGFKIIFPYCGKRASCITSGLLWKGWYSIQAQCVT